MSPAAGPGPDVVADSEVLLRRLPRARELNLIVTDRASGRERVSSSVFKRNPKRDPDGLSVFRRRVLEEENLTEAAVCNDESDAVASIVASEVRSVGLDVVPDPLADDTSSTPTRPRAHALIIGWPDQGAARIAKQLQSAAQLVSLRSPDPKPL